jgi:hypothetical protein
MLCILKKTVQQIVTSGNHDLIAVKANQGKLFKRIESHFEQTQPLSMHAQVERTRDRQTQRIVKVLMAPTGIDPAWIGVQRVIQVKRQGTRSGKPFEETMFYLSSLTLDPTFRRFQTSR